MSVSLAVQQRTWLSPQPRKTWAEVRTLVRAATGQYSSVGVQDYQVDEAIARAVETCWPRVHHKELWQCTLTGYVDFITLPWVPSTVVYVTWKDTVGTTANLNTNGASIPGYLWEVEGTQWRYLRPSTEWPASSSIEWAMLVEGKPLTAADEETYCTVPNQYIVPLAAAELLIAIGPDGGMDRISAMQIGMALKQQALLSLPATRPNAQRTKVKLDSVSTIIWRDWGQEDITFADLS